MKGLIQGFIKFKIVAAMLFAFTSSYAVDEIYTPWGSNNAIKGYDTVAYFTENKAVKGSKKFKTTWKEANWLFSSAENLALFEADPEKYAPQYGGYCAYAVSNNATASIEPDKFTIVGDKLYLNYNEKVLGLWLDNQDEFIEKADKNWPGLVNK